MKYKCLLALLLFSSMDTSLATARAPRSRLGAKRWLCVNGVCGAHDSVDDSDDATRNGMRKQRGQACTNEEAATGVECDYGLLCVNGFCELASGFDAFLSRRGKYRELGDTRTAPQCADGQTNCNFLCCAENEMCVDGKCECRVEKKCGSSCCKWYEFCEARRGLPGKRCTKNKVLFEPAASAEQAFEMDAVPME